MAQRLSRRSLAHYLADQSEGAHYATAVQQVAAYLIAARRTRELTLVVRDVEALMANRGQVHGSVVSAYALSSETRRMLESSLSTRLDAKKLSLAYETDSSLVGGFIARLPGMEMDRSFKTALQQLKNQTQKA